MELLAIIIPHHLLKFSEEQEKNIESCFLRAPKGAHFFSFSQKVLMQVITKPDFQLLNFFSLKIG